MSERFIWYIIINFTIAGIIFLPIVFAILKREKRFPLKVEEGAYILHMPQWHFWAGLLFAVLGFICIEAAMFMLDLESALILAIVLIILALMGTYLCIYFLLRIVVVDTSSLTIYSPFLSRRQIKLYEISLVEQKPYGLLGHTKSGRRFVIDKDTIGFDIIYKQFYFLGKTARIPQKEDFTITKDRQDIIRNAAAVLVFGGITVAVIISRNPEIILNICTWILAGMTVFFLYDGLNQLIWKITVSFNYISVRTLMGGEKSYSIREITMVYVEENDIVLYAGDKKIVKVFTQDKNYPLLLDRLADSKILFYTKK